MTQPNRLYADITGLPVTIKTMEWIQRIVEARGEDRVLAAMEAIAHTGDLKKFLQRVSDRLASEDARRRPGRIPTELDRDELMALIRGELEEPPRPYIFDTRALTSGEYEELLRWTIARSAGMAPMA